ncbi:transient receptor potential Ca2 channel (TRP-CC) family protein, partial [Achlya hypogyna]
GRVYPNPNQPRARSHAGAATATPTSTARPTAVPQTVSISSTAELSPPPAMPLSPDFKIHMLEEPEEHLGHGPRSLYNSDHDGLDMDAPHMRHGTSHRMSIVEMTERIPRFVLGLAYTRNSFFAKKLLLTGLGLFIVDVTAIVYLYMADDTGFAVTDQPTGCDNWVDFGITVFFTAPLIFVLFLPATGVRLFELFMRKNRTHFDVHAKVKFKVTRTWYLQFCEVIAALLILYYIFIILAIVDMVFGPSTFACSEVAPLLYAFIAFVVFFSLPAYIATFTRFREHIKMQLGAYKESNQTGDVRSHLATAKSPESRLRKRLYKAAEHCNAEELDAAIAEGRALMGDAFAQRMYSSTKLHLGFWSFSKKNPVHVAAGLGDTAALAKLSDAGFDLNALDKVGRVRFSTSDLFWFFARLVVERPWVATDADRHSKATLMTPLHCAVATSQVDTVRWLVEEKHVDVNVMAQSPHRADRLPPLFLAEHPRIVEILLSAGANHLVVPDPGHINCITALELGYLRENYAVCAVLEDWGSDVALTPMHAAAATGNMTKLQQFLKMKVNPNCLGEHGYIGVKCRTPLHWAAVNGQWSCASLLLAGGADPDFQDDMGRSPLHWAVRNNKLDVARILLDHGCDVNLLDKKGMTPIICAAVAERMDATLLKLLVSNGANINYQLRSNGDTALHLAIKHEKQETAISLVSCGANIMTTNHAGLRALDIATSTALQFAIKSAAGHRDVMISYTHSHAEFALKLRKSLEANNITAWLDTMDPSGIGGGSVWREEIAKGIANATLLVAILTDDYTRSEWCLKELACAKQVGTPVLPISTEHVRLNEELQVYLYTRQIVPFEPAITAVDNHNPRQVTYAYDDDKYQQQFRLLLDGIRDEVEKKRKAVALRSMDTLSPTGAMNNPQLAFALASPSMSPTAHADAKFVFIAHGDCHRSFVKRLYHELTTSKQIPVYVDLDAKGDPAARVHAAKEAILRCACVVVVLSAKSAQNEMLNDQLAFAEDKGRPIFPVVLHTDFTRLPPNQTYSLSRAPMHHFALDLGFHSSFDQLFADLGPHVDGRTSLVEGIV